MQGNQPLQNCLQCGAGLTLDDLRKPNCPYCGTVLGHQARAAEHAALVNQMLQQRGVHHVQVPYQYGAPPPPVGMPAPYGDYVQQSLAQAHKTMSVVALTMIIVGVLAVLGVVAAVLMVML